MNQVEQFIHQFLNKSYQSEDLEGGLVKFFDGNFDVIVSKGQVKHPRVLIIDKRRHKHVIYNDINVASSQIVLNTI